MYLDHLLPNGDFHGEYRYCVKGKAFDSTQTGRWTLKGNRLTIMVGNADGHADIEARISTRCCPLTAAHGNIATSRPAFHTMQNASMAGSSCCPAN